MRQIHRHALALGLVLALSACGGDPEPQFEADPSPAPSEVTTSAPAKEAWEEKSDDGAIAFVEHWVEAFSDAFQTGDTAAVRDLADAGCDACDGLVDLIDAAYADGGSIRGDAWSVVAARPSGTPPEGRAAVSADIEQPQQVVKKAGERPMRTSAGEATYLFELSWDGGWAVSSILFED